MSMCPPNEVAGDSEALDGPRIDETVLKPALSVQPAHRSPFASLHSSLNTRLALPDRNGSHVSSRKATLSMSLKMRSYDRPG
jgi:hypothetical protein